MGSDCIQISRSPVRVVSAEGTDLFLVMQTLVVVLQNRGALLLPSVILGGCVNDVAGKDLLPEGKAAANAWRYQTEVSRLRVEV